MSPYQYLMIDRQTEFTCQLHVNQEGWVVRGEGFEDVTTTPLPTQCEQLLCHKYSKTVLAMSKTTGTMKKSILMY